MPLCPQIVNTPITVVQTADFTVTSVVPAVADTSDGLATTIDSIEIAVNGKNKIYRQTTAPTGELTIGDIWFDTDDGNKLYYWTGTAWVSVQDNAIATAQATADSKIKTFYQASAPIASDVGDIWFDTDDGFRQYFWTGTAWTSVRDTGIAAAQTAAAAASAAATAAQTTADGKNKVFRQTSAPTASAIGDIWFDTDDDNRIYRWDGASWVANNLGNNAIANLSANKLTAGTIDASVITVSNINAGNISTGTLNADRIAAASITGSKLVANTITASQIATGTITADQIATATITGSKIAAATITASQIAANTITASQIAAATITTTQLATGTLSATNITTGTLAATVALTAESGTIGGWNISSSSIYTGTIANPNSFINSSGSALFAGNVSTATLGVAGTATIGGSFSIGSTMFAPNLNTSTSATNLRVATGSIGEVTETSASSIRFKENIVDVGTVFDIDPKKLLNLPVRAFTYKDGYLSESDDRIGTMLPGFIAEEVDAIYPVAADYGQDGPHSWNDRFIIPGLLALIQDLYKRIEILEGE